MSSNRIHLYEMVMKYAAEVKILPSIGKDPAIKDLSKNSIPGHPPAGYRPLRKGENNGEIGAAASKILNSSELGDQTPFTIGDESYMGRTEPHYHPSPPAGIDPSEMSKYPKPWGWHKGVTVFKADTTGPQGRMKLLQKVQNSPDSGAGEIQSLLSEIEKDL